MSTVRAGRVSKLRRGHRVKNGSVLRMMAIMEGDSEQVPKEFLETGRTGRRNAMPDILQQQGAEATTADLPARLQQLATTDTDEPQPCTSYAQTDPKTEDAHKQKRDGCS
ncbi:cAMP-dependent protein kinase inhibitor beta-like [Amyelois transitella]|uniref:cAMP-dependent protein kinase inhibitor beta-like n=1 Tax=Amyelois transitella TaxID=680683 RepID=UPI00298F8E01|nr:cAMP-dependent protein kinase inhibitor beta-like [Amyelois transitella]